MPGLREPQRGSAAKPGIVAWCSAYPGSAYHKSLPQTFPVGNELERSCFMPCSGDEVVFRTGGRNQAPEPSSGRCCAQESLARQEERSGVSTIFADVRAVKEAMDFILLSHSSPGEQR